MKTDSDLFLICVYSQEWKCLYCRDFEDGDFYHCCDWQPFLSRTCYQFYSTLVLARAEGIELEMNWIDFGGPRSSWLCKHVLLIIKKSYSNNKVTHMSNKLGYNLYIQMVNSERHCDIIFCNITCGFYGQWHNTGRMDYGHISCNLLELVEDKTRKWSFLFTLL